MFARFLHVACLDPHVLRMLVPNLNTFVHTKDRRVDQTSLVCYSESCFGRSGGGVPDTDNLTLTLARL